MTDEEKMLGCILQELREIKSLLAVQNRMVGGHKQEKAREVIEKMTKDLPPQFQAIMAPLIEMTKE